MLPSTRPGRKLTGEVVKQKNPLRFNSSASEAAPKCSAKKDSMSPMARGAAAAAASASSGKQVQDLAADIEAAAKLGASFVQEHQHQEDQHVESGGDETVLESDHDCVAVDTEGGQEEAVQKQGGKGKADQMQQQSIEQVTQNLIGEFEKAKASAANTNLPCDEELLASLESCLANGRVDPRTDVGQRFNRWNKKPENAKELEEFVAARQAAGHGKQSAVAEFRVKWAKTLHQETIQGKKYVKSFTKIDKNKGTMRIFAKLVEGMGYFYDPQGAIRRAQMYYLHLYKIYKK